MHSITTLAVRWLSTTVFLASASALQTTLAPTQATAEELIEKLKTSETNHVTIVQSLIALPARQSVPAILGALKRGELNKSTAREEVFEVLSVVGREECTTCAAANPPGPFGESLLHSRVFTDLDQVNAFASGLKDETAAVRRSSALALGYVAPEQRAAVKTSLIAAVGDPDPFVSANAITSLGLLGPTAASASDLLLSVLTADPARKEGFAKAQALLESQGAGAMDIEMTCRSAAATARVRILGLDCDLALYPKLDLVGQRAGAAALQAFFPFVLSAVPHATAQEIAAARALRDRVSSAMVAIFSDGKQPGTFRAALLRNISSQIDDKLPAKSRELVLTLIEKATQDPDTHVAAMAKDIERMLPK